MQVQTTLSPNTSQTFSAAMNERQNFDASHDRLALGTDLETRDKLFQNPELNYAKESPADIDEDKPEYKQQVVMDFLNIVREKYPVVLNWFTVALHSAASSLPFIPFVPKDFAKKIKDWAIVFSRYVVPLNMIHNAIEDIVGKRLFHAIARLAPPACLPFLPFFNFSMPYGIYAGINFPTEEIVKRVGELSKHNSFAENNKKVLEGLKSMWEDFINPQHSKSERFKLGSIFFASASMLTGAVGGLLFSPNSLNNIPATFFGFIRSMGGLIGDLNLILGKDSSKKEKTIGSLYAVGSLMDITQRWITDPTINELYNHAKTSLNTISTMLWTHMSTDRNRKEEKQERKMLHAKPNLQLAL